MMVSVLQAPVILVGLLSLAPTPVLVAPQGQKQTLQQTEDVALALVRANGVGTRFVLTEIRPAGTARVVSYTLVDGVTEAARPPAPGCKFVTLLAEYPKDQIPMAFGGRGFLPGVDAVTKYPGDYVIQVCGELAVEDPAKGPSVGSEAEGTVWRFRGKHSYRGVVFEGDKETPLAFLFHAQGFVYLTGKGTVTRKDGTVVVLPSDDQKR